MAIKHLTPKSKDEITKVLEEYHLNRELLEIIRKDDEAYQFVAWFISQGESSMEKRITRLNGLVDIIRGLKRI
jgi:hypothetical protein